LAHAASVEVHLYGTLLPFAETIETIHPTSVGLGPTSGGATMVPASSYSQQTAPRRLRLTSGSSNVGFSGRLAIDSSVAIIWQVESAVSPDGDPPNAVAGRNTGIGLATRWGTIIVGSWDTPYKYPLPFVSPLRGLNPFENTITANPGFCVPGTVTKAGRSGGREDAAFNRRQGNSVQYWTPTIAGWSARLGYSMNEGKATATPAAPSTDPEIFSALVAYQQPGFGVRLGYELHVDYFGLTQLGGSPAPTPTNRSSEDRALELITWYELPTGTKISAIGERLDYSSSDKVVGAVDRYQRYAFYALVQHRIEAHQLWAAFGMADDGSCHLVGEAPCSTDGLWGRQWSVGYSYSLAKSADLYAAYYQMDNGRSAAYATFPPLATVAPGATTRGLGVGILYTFDVPLASEL
jgi:predicted porin